MLCEYLLCESQQQFSWGPTHVKPTHWISSRSPTRLGISLGVHFIEESSLEPCGPCLYQQRARSQESNNCIVAATEIPAASAPSFPSVTTIAESLSLTHNHSGCWRYSLCYESGCDLVIAGLLHCKKYQ